MSNGGRNGMYTLGTFEAMIVMHLCVMPAKCERIGDSISNQRLHLQIRFPHARDRRVDGYSSSL